ncbi:uncharacterized protein LOC135339487 isoform X2 [Halichondria panicea]
MGPKIVLPSSDVEEYTGNVLQNIVSSISKPKGWSGGRNAYTSTDRPSWWPKDVVFCCLKGSKAMSNGITVVHRRKVLAAFLEKCPEQYTISRPVGQQKNSAIQKSFGTNSSKIILPSSNAEEYIGLFLRSTVSHIANPKGRKGGSFYRNNNCPSWWPKDVAFVPSDYINAVNQRKIVAAFLEKCPEQYTILSPVDQQNSASAFETDQPEDPAVGTKRVRRMPGSKIVLPSSDVKEYSGNFLRDTISNIANPKDLMIRKCYSSENCPSWWPKDVPFCILSGPTVSDQRRKVLAAFLEKCPEQYTISRPVDQDQPEDQLIGTKRARRMPRSKIVLPSSDAEEYSGKILRGTISRIVNPDGWGRGNIYTSDNCPSWWPKDVAFTPATGPKAIENGITAEHQRKILAAFLEKCPEQYTISPKKRLLNPTSSPLVGDKQPVREVSPQSSSESDQEEPVGMNQTPPTGANRTRSVGATISTAAQHASPKLILPSSCANDYYQPALISLLQKILNPQSHNFVYSSANCPSWWPTDVPFTRAEDMKAKDRTKALTAFLENCPEQYTISPPVDQQNVVSEVETDQPEDFLIYGDESSNASDEENASIPSDPEDLVNSLEQHLLDSRKRRLEAERKVEELTEEVKRLREERKFIGSIVKRSRLH